jgi:hypothetical protein
MKEIQLTRGYVALVDDEDYEAALEGTKWYSKVYRRKDGTVSGVYAIRNTPNSGHDGSKQLLHRFVLDIITPNVEVDHKDGNGLNCQKKNLRVAEHVQNSQNRGANTNNTSGFKGVSWVKATHNFGAYITAEGKHRSLGRYATAAEAAKAYDEAALQFFGEFAKTNF